MTDETRPVPSTADVPTSRPHFSVIDDPWIPVLLDDSSTAVFSTREIFHRAEHIRAISPDFPQKQLVIIRFLLAVLYRAFAHMNDHGTAVVRWHVDDACDLWWRIFDKGHFPVDVIDAYLDSIPGGADLFDQKRPFFQTPGLAYDGAGKGKKEFDDISGYLPDVPGKEDKFLFSPRSRGSLGPVDFAQAAQILLFIQGYDVSGIHSPAKGSPTAKGGKEYPPKGLIGTGYVGALGGLFEEGRNLFETLMLNWVLASRHLDNQINDDGSEESGDFDFDDYGDDGSDPNGMGCLLGIEGDLAPWDEGYDNSQTQMVIDHRCTGPVDALTWQTRRLRLVPTEDGQKVTGIIVTYGNIAQVLNADAFEMMTAWRQSSTQAKRNNLQIALMPVMHNPDRYLWQGLPSLLGRSETTDAQHLSHAAGVIEWVSYLGDRSRGDGIARPELPDINVHTQGIVYGSQSAVIETGVDDSIRLDPTILQDPQVTGLVVRTVSLADQSANFYRIFLQNLAVARGDDQKTVRDHVAGSLAPAYMSLDHLFRGWLRQIDLSDLSSTEQHWRDEIDRTLCDLASQELDRVPAPAFGEHTFSGGSLDHQTATSARALSLLRGGLAKILIPTRARRSGSQPERRYQEDREMIEQGGSQ